MKCTVDWRDIAAAQFFTGKDEARPLFCGVHIVTKDGNVTIEATDTYRAVRIETKAVEKREFEDGETVINLWNLKLNSKDICVEINADENTANVKTARINMQVDVIEGIYPNVGNLFPDKESCAVPTTAMSLNSVYVNELGKAQQLFTGNKNQVPAIEFTGNLKPVVASCTVGERTMNALIMPVRCNERDLYLKHPTEDELAGNGATKIAELTAKLKSAEQLYYAACEREDKLREERKAMANPQVDELKAEIERLKAEKPTEDTTAEDAAAEVVAQLIADHEVIQIAGETPIAIYLSGIGANTPEHAAAKAAGCKFGNHKKYGKCWYMPKH